MNRSSAAELTAYGTECVVTSSVVKDCICCCVCVCV